MADEVVSGGGQIAQEQTLQRLLDAVAGSGDSSAALKLKNLANSAGVSSKNIDEEASKRKALTAGLVSFGANLLSGTASASSLVGAFGVLDGKIGLAAQAISALLKIQEENFSAYQRLTSAGISFGGSLTDLRLSAMKTYMTLDQFTSLMKQNSTDLVALGGNVNSGAKAFAQFSNGILQSNLGTELFALGYTAESANQAMISYLAVTGQNDARKLKTDKDLQQSTQAYLEELDRLAQITGKTREELANERSLKQLSAQERMTLARMNAEDQKVFAANLKWMNSKYGDAGKDLALAVAQGRAPITKEGQALMATSPKLRAAYEEMVKASKDYGVGSKEYIAAQNRVSLAVQDGLGRIPETVLTANSSLQGLSQAVGTAADEQIAGLNSEEAFRARDKQVEEELRRRKESEAAKMAAMNQSLTELGTSLMSTLNPFIRILSNTVVPVISFLATGLSGLAKGVGWLLDGIVDIGSYLLKPFREMFSTIGTGVSATFSKLSEVINPVVEPFKKLFSSVGYGDGVLGKFFGLIGDVASFLLSAPFKFFFGALGLALDLLTGTFKVLGKVVEATLSPFQYLADKFNQFLQFLTDGLTKLSNLMDPSSWFKSSDKKPKMAAGGLITRPTSLIAGEAGTEAILPLSKLSSLFADILKPPALPAETVKNFAESGGLTDDSSELIKGSLDQLNNNVREMINAVKEVANNTKRTYEATKNLNGDHFA